MRKATWHYWLDLIMGLLSMLLVVSSTLLWVVFPRGYYAARMVWILIHKWSGFAMAVAALVHVILHWRWLVRMTRREFVQVVNRLGMNINAIRDRRIRSDGNT